MKPEDRDHLARFIADLGLRHISKWGDRRRGEWSIQDIGQVLRAQTYFKDISFMTLDPQGQRRVFQVRFNANPASDGAVVVVVISGLFLIIKQWRLCGRWTYEVPRGFADGEKGEALAAGVLARDIGEQAMGRCRIRSVVTLGEMDENTGTSNVAPEYFLVELEADGQELVDLFSRNSPVKVALWSPQKAWGELGHQIRDNHSITALTLVMKHLGYLTLRERNDEVR